MSGSIEKRGDNTYRLIVSAGVGIGGKRKKYSRTVKVEGKTDTDINKKLDVELAKLITDIEQNNFTASSKATFKEFIEKWLKEYAEKNLAPKTLYRYKEMLNSRVIESLGHLRLDKLKPMNFVEFYNNLLEDGIRTDGKPGGLSPTTIKHHHRLIHTMLETAVKWEILTKNPVEHITPPKGPKPKSDYYNEDEIMLLIKKLNLLEERDLKYKFAVYLTIATGLRLGELMGLTWGHFNMKNGSLTISQANQYVPKLGTFTKEPKNESSSRTIIIPEPMIDLLKVYKKHQLEQQLKCGNKWVDTDFMFTKWNGEAMYPYTISNWFPKFLEVSKLRKITFHDLRHTSATILINAGVNIRELSSRFGHARPSTTTDIYSHQLKTADKDASDKIGNVLFPKEKIESSEVK